MGTGGRTAGVSRRLLVAGALGAPLVLAACDDVGQRPGTPASTSGTSPPEGSSPSATASPGAAPPRLLWSDEFDELDLVTAENPSGRWASRDPAQPQDQGYADYGAGGHRCWLASPQQQLGGTRYDPFSVAGSVLSVAVQRTPAPALADAQGCRWIGGLLVSNTERADLRFGAGAYYEFRMRAPVLGRGVFPALWLYAARHVTPASHAGAEIDLMEVFGDPDGRPWTSSLHQLDSRGKGRQEQAFFKSSTSIRDWHTYGLHWTRDRLDFYHDRVLQTSVTGADAEFFADVPMSLRMDFSMDAVWFEKGNQSNSSTPSRMTMEVDYVRKYDKPF